MIDYDDKHLNDQVTNYAVANELTKTSLGRASEAQMADIISQGIDYDRLNADAISLSQNADSYGNLATPIDSPNFEQSVKNKYEGFQSNQTNAMVAAADLVANAETANQVANRKIDNLQQQKEMNDKLANVGGKLARTIAMGPVGMIAGLFNSDYSVASLGKEYVDAELGLQNLQRQDALDDQLILQKAFGQAGYNPLANDVIEPANKWEKQYFDEKVDIERNRVNAASNKLAAKNSYLDAFKALNTRLGHLGNIAHDANTAREGILNRTTQTSLGDQEERVAQMRIADNMANREFQRGQNAEQLAYNWAALDQGAKNKAVDKYIAELESAGRAETNATQRIGYDVRLAELADEPLKRASQEAIQASRERIANKEADSQSEYSKSMVRVGELGVQRANIEKDKAKINAEASDRRIAANGASGGKGGFTQKQVADYEKSASQALDNSADVIKHLPVQLTMNNGVAGNSQITQPMAKELIEARQYLNQAIGNYNESPTVENLKKVDVLTSRVNDLSTKVSKSVNNLLNPSDNKQVASMNNLRLEYNGIVPPTERPLAISYVLANDGASSTTGTTESRIGRNFNSAVDSAVVDSLMQKKSALREQLKQQGASDSEIDKLKGVNQLLALMATKQGSTASPVSEQQLLKTIGLDSVANNVLFNGVVANDGRTFFQFYRDSLLLDYERYAVSKAANAINEKYGKELVKQDVLQAEKPSLALAATLGIEPSISESDAKEAISSLRSGSNIASWRDDYLKSTVSYDNVAAALVPTLGFYDIYNQFLTGSTGKGKLNDNAIFNDMVMAANDVFNNSRKEVINTQNALAITSATLLKGRK